MSNGNGNLQEELIAHSVTRAELEMQRPVDGIVKVMIGAWTGGTSTIYQDLPDLPPFWSFLRDRILVSTVTVESRWAQAVSIYVDKTVTREWDVSGEAPDTRLQKARRRLKTLLSHSQRSALAVDFALRDNGAWAEIVRPTSMPTGVIGLNYLTSSRCMPTGDPNIPCVYWDRLGQPHELKDYQVMRFVDMTDGASPFGTGLCAARRAFNDIRQTAAVQRFRLEKITGNNPKSIFFLTGITDKQLKGIILDHKEKQEAQNILAYGGVLIAALMQREGITKVEIPIAALPDGFDLKTEIQMMSTAYANALPGITYLDLMPMTGQRAGSSAQSQVVDDQSAQKNTHLAAFSEGFNDEDLYKIMPEGVTFFFKGNDLTDRKRLGEITLAFSQAAALLVEKCQIAPEVVAEWLIDNDILPPDKSPSEYNVLESGENAQGGTTQGMIVKPPPQPTTQSPPEQVATKSFSEETLLRLSEALRLFASTNSMGTKQLSPVFNLMMPEKLQLEGIPVQPTPIVNITNTVPVPSVNLTTENHLPPLSPPPISVYNSLPEMNPNITLPETQVTVKNEITPTPVNNVILPTPIGETIETIEVEKRDKSGLLERLVKRTVRK